MRNTLKFSSARVARNAAWRDSLITQPGRSESQRMETDGPAHMSNRLGQLLPVLVQVVVHLPETALRGGGFGRLRGLLCVRMRTGDKKVAKDEAQAAPHLRLDVLDDGMQLRKMGIRSRRIPPA